MHSLDLPALTREEPCLASTQLRVPSLALLAAVADALEREHREAGRQGEHPRLAQLKATPQAFVDEQLDHRGLRGPVVLPDGSQAERVPDTHRWIWDTAQDAFCGVISLRWWPGHGEALPEHCLGHIGYNVVPWMRRQGHASRALRLMVPLARHVGLGHVTVSADETNTASIGVIERAGGRLLERFELPRAYAGWGVRRAVRYRIEV